LTRFGSNHGSFLQASVLSVRVTEICNFVVLLLLIPTFDRFLRSGLPASRDTNDVRDMVIKKNVGDQGGDNSSVLIICG